MSRTRLVARKVTPPLTGYRDASLWPFSSLSAWNRPIGDGSFGSLVDHSVLRNADAGINSTSWSISVSLTDPSYPLVTDWVFNGGCGGGGVTSTPPPSIRIASGVTGSPPVCPGASYRDGFLAATHTDGMAYGFSRATRVNDSTMYYGYHRHADYDHLVTGTGWQPSRGWPGGGHWIGGSNYLGGLIRSWELNEALNGSRTMFNHPVQVTLQYAQLKQKVGSDQATTWVWPATWSDGDGSNYTGTIPMGGLLVIPKTFSIPSSWTLGAQVLARTLQNYGAYIIGAGGGGLLFYSELGASQTLINQMRTNLNAIRDELRLVSNNGPTSVGGGGSYPATLWPIQDPVF